MTYGLNYRVECDTERSHLTWYLLFIYYLECLKACMYHTIVLFTIYNYVEAKKGARRGRQCQVMNANTVRGHEGSTIYQISSVRNVNNLEYEKPST